MLAKMLLLACTVLTADATGPAISGTVIDQHGKPVVGARVDISTAAPRIGNGIFCPSCYPDCAKFARTDGRGEFRLEELDPTLKFRLLISKPEKKAQLSDLVDPLDAGLTIKLADLPSDMPPERTLRGRVVSAEGIPVEGALVEPSGAKTGTRRWWGTVKGVDPTVTDNEGRFAMLLPDDFEFLEVEVRADGYAGTVVPGLSAGSSDYSITLPRGTSVRGRLLHDSSPLAGAQVSVVQADRSAGRLFIKAVGAMTDADGQFKIDALPADEEYALFTPAGTGAQEFVAPSTLFKALGDGELRDIGDITTTRSLTLSGKLELLDGDKLPRNTRISLGRDPAWDLIAVPVADDGTFEIRGLAPEAYKVRINGPHLAPQQLSYQILDGDSFAVRLNQSLDDLKIPVVKEREKKRVAPPLPKATFVRNPGGWVSGRVLVDGEPRAGITLVLNRSTNGQSFSELAAVMSDENGRFRIAGLATGDKYMIRVDAPKGLVPLPWRFSAPHIETVADAEQEAVLPDLKLISGGQKLHGTVVDPEGNPVPGVQVSARTQDGRFLSAQPDGTKPWTDTDSNGDFELERLPAVPLRLMVYARNPQSRSIRYPANADVELNQQDIRIVLDPTLNQPLANLDGTATPKRRSSSY